MPRLRREPLPVPRPHQGPLLTLACPLAAVFLTAGCGGGSGARIELVALSERGELVALRADLEPDTPTGRAEIGLLRSALDAVPSLGRACGHLEAKEQIEDIGLFFRITWFPPEGKETESWMVHGRCAVKMFSSGPALAWRGSFREVVSALAAIVGSPALPKLHARRRESVTKGEAP